MCLCILFLADQKSQVRKIKGMGGGGGGAASSGMSNTFLPDTLCSMTTGFQKCLYLKLAL